MWLSKGALNRATPGFSFGSELIGPPMPALEIPTPPRFRPTGAISRADQATRDEPRGLLRALRVARSARIRRWIGLHRDPVHCARRGACGALNQGYEVELTPRCAAPPGGRFRGPDRSRRQRCISGGPRRLLGPVDGDRDQLAGRRAARRFDPVLRDGVHGVAEAPDPTEHRHRRRRRRVSAADRLGRRDRPYGGSHGSSSGSSSCGPLRISGRLDLRPLGLCRGRNSDASRGRRPAAHKAADFRLQPGPGGRRRCSMAAGADRPDLRNCRSRG